MFQDMQIPVQTIVDGDYLTRDEARVLGAKNLLYTSLEAIKKINTGGTWNGNVYSYNGVNFTVNSDGTVTADGTNISGAGQSYLAFRIPSDVYGDLYFSGCPSGSFSTNILVFAYDTTLPSRPTKWDGVTSSDSDYGGTSQEIKVISGHLTDIRIRIQNGASVSNKVFYPMIRVASDLDNTYTPPALSNRILSKKIGEVVGVDTGNLIKSSFSTSETYTAPSDGFLVGYIMSKANEQTNLCYVTLDSMFIVAGTRSSVAVNGTTYYTTNFEAICVPVKKGQVIKTTAYGDYTNMKFCGAK